MGHDRLAMALRPSVMAARDAARRRARPRSLGACRGGGAGARLRQCLARHLQLSGAQLLREARLYRVRHARGVPGGSPPLLPAEAPRLEAHPSIFALASCVAAASMRHKENAT